MSVRGIGGVRSSRKPDQRGADRLSSGEDIEIGGEAQMVGDAGRHQAAEQVAGDVAGDVGGERAGGVGCAAVLAEIGERQREGGRHAQALHDAQQR